MNSPLKLVADDTGSGSGQEQRSASVPSMIDLTQALVRIPTQGGRDDVKPLFDLVEQWLEASGLPSRRLVQAVARRSSLASREVGLVCRIGPADAANILCLNACGDTAFIGSRKEWQHDPFSGQIARGWLFGRGSADSKAGIAIFAHIMRDLAPLVPDSGRWAVVLLIDGDEHTGRFGGIRQFVDDHPNTRAVLIGYPGNRDLKIGSRGFYRVKLVVCGVAQHSGSSTPVACNAADMGARLHGILLDTPVSFDPDPDFPMGPRISVTASKSDGGYSVIPDRHTLKLDVRLTGTFTRREARAYLEKVIGAFESRWGTRVEMAEQETWPAYVLPAEEPVIAALATAGARAFGRPVPLTVSGPSNVGNYLASKGIPATAGFGVTYEGIHAPDERIELASIEPVYETYRNAIRNMIEISDD